MTNTAKRRDRACHAEIQAVVSAEGADFWVVSGPNKLLLHILAFFQHRRFTAWRHLDMKVRVSVDEEHSAHGEVAS